MILPSEWKLPKLNSIFRIIDSLHQTPTFSDEGYPMIRVTDVKGGELDLQNAVRVSKEIFLLYTRNYTPKRGDIVFSRVGSYGISTYVNTDEPFCLGQNTVIAESNNKADAIYIFNVLKSEYVKQQIERTVDGSSHKTVSLKVIRNLDIPLPTLPEQQKIAQILSTWDKAIEKLEALIAAKQKRQRALMQQMLTGKKRFAEFVKSDGMQKTKFGTIPHDWQYQHIAEVARQVSVKNHAGHDLPVLSCTKHYGLVDSLAYFGKQIFSEDTSTYKVAPRNTFAYATNHIEEGSIGYQNLYDEALISPMYTVFQTKKNINDEFLYRVLKTELYRHIFEANTSASVDRRGSLRWNQFAAIKIPVPSIPEQQKIASFFAVTDKEIEMLKNYLTALKEQKKGLMQKLLTGKLRVKLEKES